MKELIAKILLAATGIAIMVGALIVAGNSNTSKSASIITTNFIGYDFARAVVGDTKEVSMLLKPGAEMHSFEPTPQDIKDIIAADFFIYVGGESDEWVSKVLADNNIDEGKTIRMMDFVEPKKEEAVEGMEAEEAEGGEGEDDEYDEHIWTDPLNAIRIVQSLRDRFVAKNPAKLDTYTSNADSYIADLQDIDAQIREIVNLSDRKELVFGDRFPFRYFVDEYGLKYYAAFPGCSDQTEASSNTIAFLINKVKSDNIPVVLKVEMSNGNIANAIADETGAKVLELNSVHNISQADFDAGVTFVSIMTKNLTTLREALK